MYVLRHTLLLTSLGVMLLLTGGRKPDNDPSLGQHVYTRVNIWYQNPRNIRSTNFHQGAILPFGTKVRITETGKATVTFFDEGTGLMTIVHVRRHSNMRLNELVDRYFSREDPKEERAFKKLSEHETRAIQMGVVLPGMTKDAVIMAYGYPPTHRTPNLDIDKWTYWKDNRNVVRVEFDSKGRVIGDNLKDLPEDDAAIFSKSPEGKKYFTKTNIWVHDRTRIYSINYHQGRVIPVGTPVMINNFGDGLIGFTVEGEEEKNTIVHLVKYSNIELEDLFDRIFSEGNVMAEDGAFQQFDDVEKENIRNATLDRGMSKRAVLMSLGYPPGHRTPDLDHHIWTYWRRRGVTMVVYFRNNRVTAVDYP